MRRSVLAVLLALGFSLVACSEQPTEVIASDGQAPSAALVEGCSTTPTLAELATMLNQLVSPGPLRNNVTKLLNKLPTRLEDRIKLAAREQIFPIQDAVLRAFYAGLLVGGKSTGTFDKVIAFIKALYCYVGLTPPSFPSTTSGVDVVVGVVFPNSPTTTIVVPSEHAAVTIPTGAAPTGTTIVITKLADSPGPLRTSLDQYPFFYHFSGTTATGPVTFNLNVIAGICLKDPIDVSDANLRLAHNVAPFGFGDVEILPRPTGTPPGLDCTDLGVEGPALRGLSLGRLDWIGRLILPAELHAASIAMTTTGVGGTTKKFSEFGIVDIFSNPGSFAPVGDLNTTEQGGSTITKTVHVSSQNGEPINRVPVTFSPLEGSGTLVGGSPKTVETDANGNASVQWVLPTNPGTYTMTATVPEEDNDPAETTDPPTGNVASTPDVAFDPSSLTFAATVLSPEITLTLAGPPTLCSGSPLVCEDPFTQDGFEVQPFWISGAESSGEFLVEFPGHFHMVDLTTGVFHGFEAHHFQHDFDRQGFKIHRVEGGSFGLKSIEYRSTDSRASPFEIGTSAITSIVPDETYVTRVIGYTVFPAPTQTAAFQTLSFTGFENVTEIYITMRGAANWRNVVLTQGP